MRSDASAPPHGPPTTRVRAGRTALAGAVLAAALLAGCRGLPSTGVPYAPSSRAAEMRPEVPDWALDDASWDKVSRLERWLATEGPAATGFWRLEAELQLAESRLELTRAELVAGAADPDAVGARSRSAEEGLRRVLAHPEATPLQLRRARTGLETSERLAGLPVRAAEPAPARGVVTRSGWGARPPLPARMTRVDGRWTRLTVHHSAEASPPELDGSLRDSVDLVRRIQHVHMTGANTGYGDIGYHFLIDPAGRVFEGRPLAYQGAHASGANNRGNVGICLLGNFEGEAPTARALTALEELVGDLRGRFGIPRSRVYGHQEFKSTICPGRHLMAWLEGYRGGRDGAALLRTASAHRVTPR